MTIQLIQETAMDHFIKFGYEGVKMAHIANEAGIKKQSLNYYYKNKETLFLDLLQASVKEECTYVSSYFTEDKHTSLEQALKQFLEDYKERFTQHKSAAFLAVLSSVPPVQLRDQTIDSYRKYVCDLKSELKKLFSAYAHSITSSINDSVQSYITLLDGLIVQLVYETPERYELALNAIWPIFWLGITSEKRNQ